MSAAATTYGYLSNYSAGAPLGAADRTVAAWIYCDAIGTRMFPFYTGSEATRGRFCPDIQTDGTVKCNYYTGDTSGNGALSATTWHHLAIQVRSSGTLASVWIDGALDHEDTISGGALNTVQDDFIVCAGLTGAFPFSGRVCEACIYDEAVPADDMAALGKGFSPARVRPSALVSYAKLIRDWKVDLGSGVWTSSGTVTPADHPRIYY